MNASSIKNIIFDLGGVILNLDYSKTEEAFIKLGINDFRKLYSQFHGSDLFINLETGKISARGFYEEIKKHTSNTIKDEEIKNAWNAMLLDFPVGRLNFLHNLKSRYKTFLLSNTNIIHYTAIQENYRDIMMAESPLENCFQKCYYSHQLGMRKPDKEIYEYVLSENNLAASETVFIDDTFPNVEGALKTGMMGIYLSVETIEGIFPGFELSDGPHLISSKSM
jgi:putative hydrolase of the HAD superfamily